MRPYLMCFKMIALLVYFAAVPLNHPSYAQSNAQNEMIKIVDKVTAEAQNSINAALKLITEATQAGDMGKTEIDKMFDEMAVKVNNILGQVDDQSELMKKIRTLSSQIKVKVKKYQGKDKDKEQRWRKADTRLQINEDKIHDTRDLISTTLAEILKVKFEIYEQIEEDKVKVAIDSVGDLNKKLKAINKSISNFKNLKEDWNKDGSAPKS